MKITNKKLLVLAITLAAVVMAAYGQKVKGKVLATATAHSVSLSWTAATVPAGSPAVTSYNVYRGTSSGGEGTTPLASAGALLAYNDTTVAAGSTYFYKITAVNSVGESAPSNEAGPFVIPNPQVPNPPTGLTGSAQ